MAGAEIIEALKYAPPVIKTLKELGAFDAVIRFLSRQKQYHVLLLGVSGTGKTTMVDHMFGKSSKISGEFRTAKSASYLGKIDTKRIEFLDTPGQYNEPYRGERKEAIRRASANSPIGVINVVSYGYHEGPIAKGQVVKGNEIRPDFLAQRQEEELRQLDEWADYLCGEGGSAKWVITVVTKADLWWKPDQYEKILAHYRDGRYQRALNAAGAVEHKVLPYCSIHKPFYNLIPMSGFYSDDLKVEHHDHLIAHLLASCATHVK